MPSQINILKFSSLLKARRGNKGLREIAEEIGAVSASTLSRIEQGKIPDLDTFLKICNWLNVSPEYFTLKTPGIETSKLKTEPNNRSLVEAHLRADKSLSAETSDALVKMIGLVYNAEKRGSKKR
jgi:transcriptional regulator with XRE-family HTH domain